MQFDTGSEWNIKLILRFTVGFYCSYLLLLGPFYVFYGFTYFGWVALYGLCMTAFQYGIWKVYCSMKERGVSSFLIFCCLGIFPPACIYGGIFLNILYLNYSNLLTFHLAFGPVIAYLFWEIGEHICEAAWSREKKIRLLSVLGLFTVLAPFYPPMLDSSVRFAQAVFLTRNEGSHQSQLIQDVSFLDITDKYIYTKLGNPVGVLVTYTLEINADIVYPIFELQPLTLEPAFHVEGNIFKRYQQNTTDRFMFDFDKIFTKLFYDGHFIGVNDDMFTDSELRVIQTLSTTTPALQSPSNAVYSYDVGVKKGEVYQFVIFSIPLGLTLLEKPEGGVVDLSKACYWYPVDFTEKISSWSKEGSFSYVGESLKTIGKYRPYDFFETLKKEGVARCQEPRIYGAELIP